jgi:Fe-S-cluster-containing hydrogenase component 2
MKVLKRNEELCIGCNKCQSVCSNTWFKSDDSKKSRINIETIDKANKITVCTQCGECIDVCSTQALTRDKNGVVQLNKKNCVGCFICVGFCLELAMMMHHDVHEPFKCVACGQCAKNCPTNAIFISDEV